MFELLKQRLLNDWFNITSPHSRLVLILTILGFVAFAFFYKEVLQFHINLNPSGDRGIAIFLTVLFFFLPMSVVDLYDKVKGYE